MGTQQPEFDKPKTQAELRAEREAQTADDSEQEASEKPKRPKRRGVVPVLPELSVKASELKSPDQRAVACVNLRLAGAPWHQICKELGYANANAAEKAYVAALAGMFPMSSWETLRQEAAERARQAYMRSTAMANATHFVDMEDDGIVIPNTEQRQWHEQARNDLALWVSITGAKAPTRLEVSADTQELNAMVQALLVAQGEVPQVEADVFDLELLPPEQDIVDADVVEDE